MGKANNQMNFSQGSPFFKSHKKGLNQFSKKGKSSLAQHKKFLNSNFRKDNILKKNNSTKSDFLKKKMKGFKGRGYSLNKDINIFTQKMQKKSKLNNEYGDNDDYGFQKKTELNKFLKQKKNTKPKGLKNGSLKHYKKAFTSKPKLKSNGIKGFKKQKTSGKKVIKGLAIETSFDEEEKKIKGLMLSTDNISFSNNIATNQEKFSSDLNIYTRAKQ